MTVLFVAGAGTDIGKTYVTALMVRALRAAGRPVVALKPVISGAPPLGDPAFATSDTAILLAAQGLACDAAAVQACSPWRFQAPLAPDMAAALEGRALSLGRLVDWTRGAIGAAPSGACVLIEGAGGVMSPVCQDATGLDWLSALGCPALLVAGSYLGAISHALTAAEALRARGVALRALVVNESPGGVGLEATRAALARFAPGAPVVTLARGAVDAAQLVATAIDGA